MDDPMALAIANIIPGNLSANGAIHDDAVARVSKHLYVSDADSIKLRG